MPDMLDGIDAMMALAATGTVSEAAARLRLTQSAVSKRIQALQSSLGAVLVERDGRRLRLTAEAVSFLERARPLVAELRALARPAPTRAARIGFTLALADSIASSWGPAAVRRALHDLATVDVELHAHRSVLVIELVRLGRYDLGMCTEPPAAADLVLHPLVDEPLVLVAAGAGRRGRARAGALIAIEPTSATWRAVQPLLRAHHPSLLGRPTIFVESFGAVLQMARAGFGEGLVPIGLAVEARLPRRAYRELPGITRRVCLVARKMTQQLAGFAAFRDRLASAAKETLAR